MKHRVSTLYESYLQTDILVLVDYRWEEDLFSGFMCVFEFLRQCGNDIGWLHRCRCWMVPVIYVDGPRSVACERRL